MAVVVADPLNLDLDRIGAIVGGHERIEDPVRRAMVLRGLWLGIYSDARDRGMDALALVALQGFSFSHETYESLTAPP